MMNSQNGARHSVHGPHVPTHAESTPHGGGTSRAPRAGRSWVRTLMKRLGDLLKVTHPVSAAGVL